MKKQILRFTLSLLMCFTLPLTATAQVVDIPDPHLVTAIKAQFWNPPDTITVDHMANLTRLEATDANISDLTGLERATNLWDLDLSNNSISDISVLARLTKLERLYLPNNSISDISALARLTKLWDLDLSNNSISDISVLVGLTSLRELDLSNNNVSDFSVLVGLTALWELSFENNPISEQVVDIPDPNLHAIIENSLGKASGAPITVAEMVTLKSRLDANSSNISNLTGLEFAIFLIDLDLSNNSISDISALARLTNLRDLDLSNNSISDISALADLTNLWDLDLSNNSISDISVLVGLTSLLRLHLYNNMISNLLPLVENVGWDDRRLITINRISGEPFDRGLRDWISIAGNPLSDTSINAHIPTLRGNGIDGLYRSKLFLPAIAPVTVGQTFTLDLAVRHVFDLAGWQLDLAFNPAILKAVSVDEGDFLSRNGRNTFFHEGEIDNAAGSITGVSGAVLGASDASGAGTLLSINFEAKAAGEGWLRLSEDRLGAVNGNQIHYDIALQPIIVEPVIAEPTYDLNGDEEIDVLDLMVVAQNIGKANPQADANHDGTVDVFDLIAVAQHLDSTAQAPSGLVYHQSALHSTTIKNWIDMAHAADDGSLAFRQGIVNLKRLLTVLIPDKTTLLTNYPNPFNPETWIPYHLAHAADVTLTIYDTQGALIHRLELGYQMAGFYTNRTKAAYWDGRNNLGEPVGSGVYFYTLTAGDYSATRKMLILK